jgi:hypothetical protein
MLALTLGLFIMLCAFSAILADMDRRRRQLGGMIERLEPLVDRPRRLVVRNMRGLNSSLFYTSNLLDQFEREVSTLERANDLPAPEAGGFSLKPGKRYRDLEDRLAALEALLATPEPDRPADVSSPETGAPAATEPGESPVDGDGAESPADPPA